MSRKIIDGRCFAEMLKGGAAILHEHINEINDLNVFPVPDGDTGTNMAKTIDGGLSEISSLESSEIGVVSDKFAHGVLLGARGHSGVILSQIFAGINCELSKYDAVDALKLASAFKNGIKRSYAAVQNPTEGTILTVFRESTEYAATNITDESSVEDFFRLHIEKAKVSLENTKELLPLLKEADVVDSGAAGYLYIIMGMYAVLVGELDATAVKSVTSAEHGKVNIDLFTRDSKLEYGYCTEFLLRLMSDRTDPDTFDIKNVTEALDVLGGESVVAYKEGDIVKVHVHTFDPGAVLSKMRSFGEFLTVKIENMSLDHTGEVKQKMKSTKKYAVLTVATGDGLCALFRDLGADEIVMGGQTSNPSIEEFINAFERCESENIIVLPNNKNVFLAAKQAADLYDKAKIHIIPTKNLMQGYAALSVITPAITDIDLLVKSAEAAAKSVIGSEITRAVRDVTLNGKRINEGDYIAITDGEVDVISNTAENAVKELVSNIDTDEYEIVTLFVGKDVSEDTRAELTAYIEDEYPDITLEVYVGGQDVYDYLIAIE